MQIKVLSATTYLKKENEKELAKKFRVELIGYGNFEAEENEIPEGAKVGDVFEISFSLVTENPEEAAATAEAA